VIHESERTALVDANATIVALQHLVRELRDQLANEQLLTRLLSEKIRKLNE